VKRNKSVHGNGSLTPDYGARRARNWARKCEHCAEMYERLMRCKKVIADKELHIINQQAFIEMVKRMFKEEAGDLKVSPLGRDAKRGNL